MIDRKIATSAGTWYQGGALDDTEFGFYASPRDGNSLQDVEKATDEAIARLLADGVTEEEVAKAKSRMIKQTIFSQDSQATLARIYGGSLVLGSTIADVEAWPDRIGEVTAEAVNKVARKYLEKQRSVTGYLTPEAKQG